MVILALLRVASAMGKEDRGLEVDVAHTWRRRLRLHGGLLIYQSARVSRLPISHVFLSDQFIQKWMMSAMCH
jgi:hypothetical protein